MPGLIYPDEVLKLFRLKVALPQEESLMRSREKHKRSIREGLTMGRKWSSCFNARHLP